MVALHSLFVGIALMFLPAKYFVNFGYNEINENFFRAQGGIFHIVMVTAYLIAARDPIKNKIMVRFSFIAKMIATIFLIGYFLLVDSIFVVLLSGIGDFAMGAIIYFMAKENGALNGT